MCTSKAKFIKKKIHDKGIDYSNAFRKFEILTEINEYILIEPVIILLTCTVISCISSRMFMNN